MGPVLIVQGVGCAQLARVILSDYTCVDWDEIDVSGETFTGRDVQLWALDEREALKRATELV